MDRRRPAFAFPSASSATEANSSAVCIHHSAPASRVPRRGDEPAKPLPSPELRHAWCVPPIMKQRELAANGVERIIYWLPQAGQPLAARFFGATAIMAVAIGLELGFGKVLGLPGLTAVRCFLGRHRLRPWHWLLCKCAGDCLRVLHIWALGIPSADACRHDDVLGRLCCCGSVRRGIKKRPGAFRGEGASF
jgi:hypothetical protein